MNKPRRTRPPVLRVAMLCLGALLTAAPTLHAAADRGDTPGLDLRISPGVGEYTQRFSWLHWWETRRAAQQRFGSADEHAAWAVDRLGIVEPRREQIIDKLVPLVKDTKANPYTRSGATIALARMRYEKLTELIVSDQAPSRDAPQQVGPSGQPWPVGLVGDDNVRVRVAGWLALGLLDTEASRALLTDDFVWEVSIDDSIARVTAFGFLKEMTSDERDFLMMKMRNSRIAEVQRMALWALDQHDTEANDKVFQAAVKELRSPYSVAQAMQAGGPMDRLKTHRLLTLVIDKPEDLSEFTVFNHINRGVVWQSSCTFGVKEQLTISALLGLTEISPAQGRARQDLRRALVERLEEGPTPPDMHEGGSHEDERVVGGKIADYDRGPTALAFAMQAIGDHQLDDDIRVLEGLLDGETRVKVRKWHRNENGTINRDLPPTWEERTITQRNNPARGYAAAAMGLMLQRLNPETKLGEERPIRVRSEKLHARMIDRLGTPLARVLMKTNETADVRCAAAIALGLSGQEKFRAPLREVLTTLEPDDVALYGYTVEALGMLNDPDTPRLVEEYLKRAGDVKSDNDLLARRSLASALIFCDHTKPEIEPLLVDAWSKDPYAGLAMARAAAVRGEGAMLDAMLGKLDDSQHSAVAAMSLAHLVDVQSPWRMSVLTQDMNYALDYRTPLDLGWNQYSPGDQAPLPTRLVTGFDDPFVIHALLMTRLPGGNGGSSVNDFVNDDSNGIGFFMFQPEATPQPTPAQSRRSDP